MSESRMGIGDPKRGVHLESDKQGIGLDQTREVKKEEGKIQFFDSGFSVPDDPESQDDKKVEGDIHSIPYKEIIKTSVGLFILGKDSCFKISHFEREKINKDEKKTNKYGEYIVKTVLVAKGKDLSFTKVMQRAGELRGNERETGFFVNLYNHGYEVQALVNSFPFADINGKLAGGYGPWIDACEKNGGSRKGESFKDSRVDLSWENVVFKSVEQAQSAIEEAKKEYEDIVFGKKE